MLTGAWLATAAGGAWPWLAQAAACADATRTFAIVDSTLECGASFARYAAQLRLPTFETGDDAGALWFTTLAPLLDAGKNPPATPSLIGFTRASDYFVLQHLALRTGRFVEHRFEAREEPHARPAYVAFALTPRS
ncbi:conserved hypothetical secreted protein [Burkholderia sp. H160]|nr:conserved hypothetical secreted protein [Burkholderia sp. H160]